MEPSDELMAEIDAVYARGFQLYESCSRLSFLPEAYAKKSPARIRRTKDGPPLTAPRKEVSVSGASTPPAGRRAKLTKSTSIPSMSPATPSMSITTSTPDQRIARLLAEGARILAIHPGQSGIDVTHDIVGVLELCSGARDGLECAIGSAEER